MARRPPQAPGREPAEPPPPGKAGCLGLWSLLASPISHGLEKIFLRKRWRTLPGNPCKVRLHAGPRAGVFGVGDVSRPGRGLQRLVRLETAGRKPVRRGKPSAGCRLQRIFDRHKGHYGALRLAVEVDEEGQQASRRRVAKKFKATTQSKHNLPVARICWSRGLKSNGTETYAKPTSMEDRRFRLQSLADFDQQLVHG